MLKDPGFASRPFVFGLGAVFLVASACAPATNTVAGTGGGSATGGRAATGGSSASGGNPGSGGNGATPGGGSGGSLASGGTPGSGGGSGGLGSGGAAGGTASGGGGGAPDGGTVTGGASQTGGRGGSATGGRTASGGAAGTTAPGTFFSVVTNRYDNARSGANLQETTLTTSNVNQSRFGLLFSRAVDGQMYAQPLYLGGLMMPDNKVHNVVFAATQHNTVYAFDADNAATTAPLWSKNLGPSAPVSIYSCTDMLTEVGITSTPTIDKATGTLFVVSKGQEGTTWVQRLHAMDVTTGAEKPGSPVVISASVPGTGDGSSGGTLRFDAKQHLNRPGLLFQNGVVYIAFSSHCDGNPYHGWVISYSYDGAAFTQTHAFVTSPNGNRGGIWQSGVGISADATNLYVVAGNGSTRPTSPQDYSESVVKLGISDFLVKDFWTPTSYGALNSADSDLCSGAILIPHNLLLTGSKDGRLYVLDSTSLGKYVGTGDAILQTLTTPGKASGQRGHLHGGPIYYSSGGTEWVYLWPEETQLMGYKLDPATRRLGNLVQTNMFSPGHPGGFLSVSSNNGAPGTGILWGSVPQVDAWHVTAPGTLYAVDATDITKLLWSSEQNAARDAVGDWAKTVPPMVANGRVYLSTFGKMLRVYGLLN